MKYRSTRGGFREISAAEAIKRGIAPNGGLYVPVRVPILKDNELKALIEKDYNDRALDILGKFLTDFKKDDLEDCIYKAYGSNKFDSYDITPVRILNDNVYILEQWHGPTCAFKDVALQILPHLLKLSLKKTGETKKTVILVATSGDTGKAALEGFKDIENMHIIVFFPNEGVSEIQRRQMVTQEGSNISVIAVNGNFDDTQNGVKDIFTDEDIISSLNKNNLRFTSANSINWGRLAPQIVYYFSAYADMVKNSEIKYKEEINIVVPTGNFGNILAAYYAKQMGLPVKKLICASNSNNILTDFIETGNYNMKRKFIKTMSPSMDILISSNLERLLFEISGHDAKMVRDLMKELKENNQYKIKDKLKKKINNIFWAGYSSEEDTSSTINSIYKDYNYVIDTHTAVAIDVYDKYVVSTHDITKTLIASTASPFKFNQSVINSISDIKEVKGKSEFELLKELSKKTKMKVPDALVGLEKKEIRFNDVCNKDEMKKKVKEILGI